MAVFFFFGGIAILISLFMCIAIKHIQLPPIVVYIAIGLLANAVNTQFHFFNQQLYEGLHILAEMGIIILLFRVGLESNITVLIEQLKNASLIWLGNISVSALLGYLTAHYLLGFAVLPSLFVAIALSATSVGVAAAIWHAMGKIDTPDGALLIDVAELDDISAIFLMALLFSLAPLLMAGNTEYLLRNLTLHSGILVLKFAGFVGACVLFSKYLEDRLTGYFKARSLASVLVAVVGVAFIISGIASLLGFSLAVGAIFAGFAFSRDPAEIEIDRELETIFQIFVPFFFINIGMGIKLELARHAVIPGILLFVAAVLGKLIGTAIPALMVTNKRKAILLGVSMVPRAEIAMIIMLYGYQIKPRVIPSQLFGAMVIVTVLSCLLVPPILHRLFARLPDEA